MKTLTFISCTLGIAISLSACGSDGILLGELIAAAERGDGEPASDEPRDDPPSAAPYSPPPSDPYGPGQPAPEPQASSDEAVVVDIMLRYCGACHDGPSESSAGLEDIGDIDALVRRGLILPGDREGSRIYQRMVDETMPPLLFDGERPTDAEVEFVGAFIDRMD